MQLYEHLFQSSQCEKLVAPGRALEVRSMSRGLVRAPAVILRVEAPPRGAVGGAARPFVALVLHPSREEAGGGEAAGCWARGEGRTGARRLLRGLSPSLSLASLAE